MRVNTITLFMSLVLGTICSRLMIVTVLLVHSVVVLTGSEKCAVIAKVVFLPFGYEFFTDLTYGVVIAESQKENPRNLR